MLSKFVLYSATFGSVVMCGVCIISAYMQRQQVSTAVKSHVKPAVVSPIVIQTWPYIPATEKAWQVLSKPGSSAVDAVEFGCHVCELDQCFETVGYGGSPDEQGNTMLDAMIMDGQTHSVGAVAQLRRVKNAIGVARAVMERTEHTLLVGEKATEFAEEMGFTTEKLSTNKSITMWKEWNTNNCQPNFRKNVVPNPKTHCGPYKPDASGKAVNASENTDSNRQHLNISEYNHDTIGMVAIDASGNIAAATSTNGAKFKVPGRVGDSPIAGSGCYVDAEVGGAAGTGDGDILMRFMPTYQTVESMRLGLAPAQAVRDALDRVRKRYPKVEGAIVAVNMKGEHGGACTGFSEFSYTLHTRNMTQPTIVPVKCY